MLVNGMTRIWNGLNDMNQCSKENMLATNLIQEMSLNDAEWRKDLYSQPRYLC